MTEKAIFVIKRMKIFFKPYIFKLLAVMFIGGLGAFFNILLPGRIEEISGIIESQIGHDLNKALLLKSGSVCALIILGMFLGNYFFGLGMEICSQRISADIRSAINSKINRISMQKLDQMSAGDLIANITTDVNTISIAISQSIGALFANAVVLIGAIVAMLIKSIPLAICVISFTLLGVIISTVVSGKTLSMRDALRMEQANINGMVDETLNGFMVIRSFNSEDDILDTFRSASERYMSNLKKSQFVTEELAPLMTMLNNLTYVVVCIVGAYLMVRGNNNVTIGVIIAFLLYARMLSTPLTFFSGIINMLALTMVNCLKIINVLDMPENTDEGKQDISGIPGAVEFKHVRFGYTEEKEVIHDFNADIKPGMKVAIVGHTGAGKTTLVNLLMRFYETNSGQICIDGTDIKDIPRERLHQILGMVMQDNYLFNISIRNNILYFAPEATEEDLKSVVEKCSLSHFIETLPQGIDTVLSEEVAVSSGQKQLISIARTMIKKPHILILDEATSSVDTRTELMIQRALDELSKGHTSFVIAHRLSTIRNADVIFVMSQGDIAEMGTHEELLKKDGIYTRLYRSQFENAG